MSCLQQSFLLILSVSFTEQSGESWREIKAFWVFFSCAFYKNWHWQPFSVHKVIFTSWNEHYFTVAGNLSKVTKSSNCKECSIFIFHENYFWFLESLCAEKKKRTACGKERFWKLKTKFFFRKKNCYMFKTPHTIWSFKELNSLYG